MTIKVLHVVTSLNCGGIENLLISLSRCINKNKIQFDYLVHTDKKGFFDHEIKMLGGEIFQVKKYPLWRINSQIKEYIKFFNAHPEYQIIHNHTSSLSLGLVYSVWKLRRSVRIVHVHSSKKLHLFEKSNASMYIKVLMYYLCGYFLTHRFACSQAGARWAFGRHWKKAIILNNGIDTQRFIFNPNVREQVRREHRIDNKYVVGHIGSFTYPKNHSFILTCFAELKKLQNNAFLILIGDGPLRTEIEKKIIQLKISDSVLLTGVQKETEKYLQAMDVFLFPSNFEGFPITTTEAQASGLPIIASDVITPEIKMTDLVRFVSLNDSAKRWAEVIIEETQKKRLAREEYATIVKKNGYDIKDVADWLTEFYLNNTIKTDK